MAEILVFDDAADILHLIEIVLKIHGHTPIPVGNKMDFDMELNKKLPDLIILDINLQNVDGRDICMLIKNTAHTNHIPVILMSANIVLLYTYKDYCADAILEKPFELKVLINTVDGLLKGAQDKLKRK